MTKTELQAHELAEQPNRKTFRLPVSNACANFVANADDIRDFYTLHQAAKADGLKLVRSRLYVANKAVFVLVIALWEAYCEDLADEAIRLLVQHGPSWDALPRPLLRAVSKELRQLDTEMGPWALAGEGWRGYLTDRLMLLGQRRNYSFATPKSKNVDSLFLASVGIMRVSDSWTLPFGPDGAREQLDAFVDLRNAIAHRYVPGRTVAKKKVKDAFNLVARLVSYTDAAVGDVIRGVTGKDLWAEGYGNVRRLP